MPIRPPNRGQEWQLQQIPLVIKSFRRPFYIRASNNGLGPIYRPVMKPANIVHVKKITIRQAISNGTVLPAYLKLADIKD